MTLSLNWALHEVFPFFSQNVPINNQQVQMTVSECSQFQGLKQHQINKYMQYLQNSVNYFRPLSDISRMLNIITNSFF